MGLLLVGVLAGILIGFAWLAPSGHPPACTFQWQGCFDRIEPGRPPPPQVAPSTFDGLVAEAKFQTAPKPAKHTSARPHRRVALAKEAAQPTRISAVPSAHVPVEAPDTVVEKAKASVAAKMENPASAEFSDMDRAFRKNTLGRAVDTICGHVRGKNASGGNTGDRPFLYLVKEDDAYVVDGKPDSAPSIAYRNICN
jgi:hypothetical protein